MAKNDKNKAEKILTAESFVEQLKTLQSDEEAKKTERYFKSDYAGNRVIGIRMKQVFDLAREYSGMPLEEIDTLLQKPYYEARMGAVSIMDFQARDKKTMTDIKKKLFDLYISRHDRINNWDLVDRSSPWVVGGYLADKPRDILYHLAQSENVWERRTAIVSTWFFIRRGEVDDTFRIAELLINDKHGAVQKAVGSWLRTAGDKAPGKLIAFLDKHASVMSSVTLRYAIGKLDKKQQEFYKSIKTRG